MRLWKILDHMLLHSTILKSRSGTESTQATVSQYGIWGKAEHGMLLVPQTEDQGRIVIGTLLS